MKPSVGRIVHYVGTDGYCCAAIVTGIADRDPGGIYLTVFLPGEDPGHAMNALGPSEAHQAFSWHWPERDPEESDVAHAVASSPLRPAGAPDEGARLG